ncbi:MAG: hypothetical protein J0H99_07030 [Rhodospirillales bacterium]|nr:hypothetical protein [Rhodospirillales bacterium]
MLVVQYEIGGALWEQVIDVDCAQAEITLRIERDVGIVLESLALFVRYELTVTAPLPEDDQVSRTIGQERFQAFLDQVCRRIAGGKDFRAEVLARNGSEVRHDH